MSISALSASSASFYGTNDLHPLEITFRETVQSLQIAMEHLSLEDIKEISQKLNAIIERMQDKRLPFAEKYRDQATRLSEQAAAVLSAHMPPPAMNDGEPDLASLNAQDAFAQCEQWLELAKNAENPMAVLDQIENVQIRSFTAVQVAYLLSPEQKGQALHILKNYVKNTIHSAFYKQTFDTQTPHELASFPVAPVEALIFVNNYLSVEDLNASIHALEGLDGNLERLELRGTHLRNLFKSIPDLAKLYMEDLRTHQEEQLLETALQHHCDTTLEQYFSELNCINLEDYSNDQLEDFIKLLERLHFMRLPVQENYWERFPQKFRDHMQNRYFGEIPRIVFSPLPNTLATPFVNFPQNRGVPLTPFLCSRDLANMAGVQSIWNKSLQHLVLPRFRNEVEQEMNYFPEHQTQLHLMVSASSTPFDAFPCRYVQLSSYGPTAARGAIQAAFRQAVNSRLLQGPSLHQSHFTHPSYPALPLQHFSLIENFYLMPIYIERDLGSFYVNYKPIDPTSLANSISFIKTVLKDDPELAFEIVNKASEMEKIVLLKAITEEIPNDTLIFEKVFNKPVVFRFATEKVKQLLDSGRMEEGAQYLERHLIPALHRYCQNPYSEYQRLLNDTIHPFGFTVTKDFRLKSIPDIIASITSALKDDPALAFSIANGEGLNVQPLLWAAIIQGPQDAPYILPKIEDKRIRLKIAVEMGKQLLDSGKIAEGIQFFKDHVVWIIPIYQGSLLAFERERINIILLPYGFEITKYFALQSRR